VAHSFVITTIIVLRSWGAWLHDLQWLADWSAPCRCSSGTSYMDHFTYLFAPELRNCL